MAEVQDDTAEGPPLSPSETLYFLDLVRQLAANPTAGQSWEADVVRKLLVWLLWESDLNTPKPERNRQDIFVIHCLLATQVFHIDELHRAPRQSVVETLLSRAVGKSDEELITFLLKMGASLDVLIGPVLSIGKPALFASDRSCPVFASLILQHGKAPSRLPVNSTADRIWEMENGMRDHRVFIQELQSNNIVQLFDKGIEYEMAQMIANPEIIKTWTRIHRAFVYARINQRRPRGPLKSELVQMGQLLTYKCDISVDSYLIDELIERKTALFEALYRRNLMQVEWLLRVHHANPNEVCMTGQLLWNDDVMERFPIEHTLRGFMVSSLEDSALFGKMMNLLMDYGSTDLTQTTSLMRILTDNVSLQLVCPELLHFMSMSDRIYDRTPAVFTEALRVEYNIGIPSMLRVCERKWLEDVLGATEGSQSLDDVLSELPVFLPRITPPDRFFVLPQSFKLLTVYRAYRSLAVLLQTYGARPSMVEPYCKIIDGRLPNMEDIYNDSYESSAFQIENVKLIHKKRVLAFIKVLARLFPMKLEVRNFLRKYYRLLILDPNALLPLSVYKLQNQCVSVVHQEVTAGRLKRTYIVAFLPPVLYKEVFMSERELLNVADIMPAEI